MNKSRNTLKKVIIIYVIAGILVAFLYISFGKYLGVHKEVNYEFDQAVINQSLSASIETTTELGKAYTGDDESASEDGATDEISEEAANEIIIDSESDESVGSDKHYYKYRTTNKHNRLRVRKEPSTDGEIIYKLAPGATGYVLSREDGWSYIRTDKCDGYSSDAYLTFEELDPNNLPEDFPEDYR